MKNLDLENLLEKYHAGECTPEERALVEDYYINHEVHPSKLSDLELESSTQRAINRAKEIPFRTRSIILKWEKTAVIAAALTAVILTVYFFDHNPKTQDTASLADKISPGTNKATLTLSNGKQIDLTDAGNGALASQAGMQIIKSANGKVVYKILDQKATHLPNNGSETNTISTPRGGQYQIELPDGTKVWLNAASSLRFPATFQYLVKRTVELKGEAYFEVSKDKRHPFVVKGSTQDVEVLGTHFNISNYPDEASIKTTLLEGSVKISTVSKVSENMQKILKPGQQSILSGTNKLVVKDIDTAEAVSWRKGYFQFHGDDVRSVMRQIGRWYDIEIVYEGDVSRRSFGGQFHRNVNLSQVLQILQSSNLKFRMDGRKLIVMNN